MAFFSAQSHKYLLPNLLPYTTTRLRDIDFTETLDYYIIQFIFRAISISKVALLILCRKFILSEKKKARL